MACEASKHPQCMLESLRLDRRGLTHACYLRISQILTTFPSLSSLSLAGDEVPDEGVKVSQCTPQKLALQGCRSLAAAGHTCAFPPATWGTKVSLLCGSLRLPHCGLQRLMLNRCNLDTPGGGFLTPTLVGHARRMQLSLSLNPLEDSGVKLPCEVTREPSCHLQDWSCSAAVSLPRAVSLSCAIARSGYLRSLDLAGNAGGDVGVTALREGLKRRRSALRRLGKEEAVFGLCGPHVEPTNDWAVERAAPCGDQEAAGGRAAARARVVIDGGWYSFDEDDRFWRKN
ncbi:NACHT, LRR and PYD domains-containing protein 5 [Plecturocebus cupreus]